MGTAIAGIYTALLLSSSLALPPTRKRVDTEFTASNFVGEGTNELATAILQGYVDVESNLAFSPLGYSTLLAILAEGARGDTRGQLINALRLPEDPQVTRRAYKAVLGRLNERNSMTHPEFRNWFYVYKNFSVKPDYKTILQENYLTEVKDVDRLDRDAVKVEAESMEGTEPAPVSGDVLMPEVNVNVVKKEKTEVPESISSEMLVDPILPEKMKEVMPEKNEETEKGPDKIEDSISFSEPEEIMQVSEEDPTKKSQGGPLKIVFPIPFPEKLKLRKMFDERGASPSGAVLTMQEEMLGNQKEIQKSDEKNSDEKIEPEKADEMKGTETTGEEIEIQSHNKKEETMEEIKGEIKNDNIKESGNMELIKDKEEGNKFEAIKVDTIKTMKDDKMDILQDDKMEVTKEDKMEAKKEDKMEVMKDDKVEETKEDKMEVMIDDKLEEMKDDKIEEDKEGKTDATKEEEKDKVTNDNLMEATKYDKTEVPKEDKMEATKDDSTESAKGDKTGEMKNDRPDAVKGEQVEATKDGKVETPKDDKIQVTKDDKMEKMNVDTVINEKEKEGTDPTVEGMKDEVTTDDIKKEETITEDKEEKNEDVTAGAVMLDPVNEGMEVIKTVDRKARNLDWPRLGRIYLQSDDVTSSLSSNNIVRKDTKSETISQMLVFNGLFFKGTWATPFLSQSEDSFYKSESEKSTVTMMSTEGNFRVGNIPELDSAAIEVPYKGGRYSLLVLIPNSWSGLSQLISDLAGYSLSNIQKHLQFQEVVLSLPLFEIQTTTRPIESLKKFGVSDVFSKDKADLSRISNESGLFVEDLVQLVTVRVDNGSSSYNQITAGNPSSRSGLFKFVASHPFLYFVRDTEDNIIVVAGKVTDPSNIRKSL